MKELEELTADIREKLPRLKELEAGCVIDFTDIMVKYTVSHSFRDLFQYHYYLSCPHYYGPEKPNGRHIFEYHEQDCISQYSLDEGVKNEDVKILGKEPMLHDVLDWHTRYYSKNSHFEVSNIIINDVKCPAGVFLDYSEEDTARFIWDLSKIYLKDQSPELIKFLHSLIKTK